MSFHSFHFEPSPSSLPPTMPFPPLQGKELFSKIAEISTYWRKEQEEHGLPERRAHEVRLLAATTVTIELVMLQAFSSPHASSPRLDPLLCPCPEEERRKSSSPRRQKVGRAEEAFTDRHEEEEEEEKHREERERQELEN